MRIHLIPLTILLFFSTKALSAQKDDAFFFNTYDYAKSSKIMNIAAQCELTSNKLNLSNTENFFTTAIAKVSMNLDYQSHALLEYSLAYDVVKNYHYGRLTTIEIYDKENSNSIYKDIYKSLNCANF